jgi:hypothetical protein
MEEIPMVKERAVAASVTMFCVCTTITFQSVPVHSPNYVKFTPSHVEECTVALLCT